MTHAYDRLLERAEKINVLLPDEYKDAYFQLVLHPVKACANLYDLYFNVAENKYSYAKKWTEPTNSFADKAKAAYDNDSLISLQYNQLNNGKWNHMMDQTHIGYTYWQQPMFNKMPDVKYADFPSSAMMPADVIPKSKTAQKLIPVNSKGNVFFERDGYVSIEADHFTKATNAIGISWKVLPDLGRNWFFGNNVFLLHQKVRYQAEIRRNCNMIFMCTIQAR